jgi:hypothetical protein
MVKGADWPDPVSLCFRGIDARFDFAFNADSVFMFWKEVSRQRYDGFRSLAHALEETFVDMYFDMWCFEQVRQRHLGRREDFEPVRKLFLDEWRYAGRDAVAMVALLRQHLKPFKD